MNNHITLFIVEAKLPSSPQSPPPPPVAVSISAPLPSIITIPANLTKAISTKKSKSENPMPSKKVKGELNLSKHCGVIANIGDPPCQRSITCKIHSVSLKRAVVRNQTYDELYQAQRGICSFLLS